MSIEHVKHSTTTLALIVRSTFSKPGVTFLTEPNLYQQLAYMNHPKGKVIEPHLHNKVERHLDSTQEVLFIRKGILQVDFYDQEKHFLESRKLFAGDVILLVSGGHGFKILEDIEMYEVKQGPFMGEIDKTRFTNEGNL